MKRNSFPFGCIIGLLPPIVAHLLNSLLPAGTLIDAHPLGLYVMAALINLLLVRFFYRNLLEQSARGVILVTFAAALLLIFTEKLSLA